MKKFLMLTFFVVIVITICFAASQVSFSQKELDENKTSDIVENLIHNETTNIIDNSTNTNTMVIITNEIGTNSSTADNINTTTNEASSSIKDNQKPNIVTPPSLLENGFELPVYGASGYASISMKLQKAPNEEANTITTLRPGTGFQILKEQDNWWYVSVSKKKGWLESKYCMINLPDVLPSAIYDDTNSYSSMFMSSGEELPDITGKALYNAYTKNQRLGKKQYIMPVIYDTAKKICKAQHLALENNQSLKIYETFRPYQTQKSVASSLSQLIEDNEVVKNGIYTKGWNKSWFIAQSLSNHQRGIAIDVSLVDIQKSKYIQIGDHICLEITKYKECKMPTKMHELSAKAVTFQYGVNTQSKTAWQKVPFAKSMTTSAKTLQAYFVEAGMYPISSEWWHFNDLETKEAIGKKYSVGQFYITKCYSTIPK